MHHINRVSDSSHPHEITKLIHEITKLMSVVPKVKKQMRMDVSTTY